MSLDLREATRPNKILSSLAPADFDLLRPQLTRVDLPLRKSLEVANKKVDHVFFPERGFASVVAGKRGHSVEVGLIGSEGMTGLAVVLGAGSSPNATYMQSAGDGWRLSSVGLRAAMDKSPTLRHVLLNFAHAFLVQTAQTAFINGRGTIEARLARWLLMAHDRLRNDEMQLTHEFLAIMLGVRRTGVTEALNRLDEQGLVRAARGRIVLLDRKGLEKLADNAYGTSETEFRRLFGKNA